MTAATRFDNDVRYRAENHPSQTALTPAYILTPVRADLGGIIGLDPCTTPDNPVDAVHFCALPVDGAAEPWIATSVYCNPPYGAVRDRWVDRCIEAGAAGIPTILLIPAAPDTRTWQRAAACADAVVFIRGRVKFGVLRPNRRQVAASHPSSLIGWNTDLAACSALGMVVRAAAVPSAGDKTGDGAR